MISKLEIEQLYITNALNMLFKYRGPLIIIQKVIYIYFLHWKTLGGFVALKNLCFFLFPCVFQQEHLQ